MTLETTLVSKGPHGAGETLENDGAFSKSYPYATGRICEKQPSTLSFNRSEFLFDKGGKNTSDD